ncbi:hypothetical protein KGI01_07690 [Kurthia gibsonii]|nr:hypothetical protein KGI01_07690 [Kurthia gibsonii]
MDSQFNICISHCTFIHCDHADFVVLEQDFFTVSSEKISETTVKETYVAGQCVYQKQNHTSLPKMR